MPRGPLQTRDRSPVVGGRRKVVLVTRGATGLGQALTLGLAGAGFDVAVQVTGAPGVAGRLSKDVRRQGRRILLLDAAGAATDGEEELLREIEAQFGRLDALVTLPGPAPVAGDASVEATLEEPFRLVRSAAHLLRDARGSVVHCLEAGGPGHSTPMRALTQALARILSPWVRVNAVAPPELEGGGAPPPNPAPEEVVRAVLYVLASPHLNGEVVRAHGPR